MRALLWGEYCERVESRRWLMSISTRAATKSPYFVDVTALILLYSPHYRHQRYPGVEAGKFVDADPLGSASLRTPNGRALAGVR